MARKKLVVIDGKSVLYRGYYAMTHLSNKAGKPTGATYGFAMMGLRIIKDLKPDYVIVAWDMSKTNIRSRRELYPEYKAQRKPMPEDLREQIPDVRRLCAAFSWPFLEVDDYEADDIMGTLREQAYAEGIDVVLVTSDLDTLQLVNGHTSVLTLKKGLTQTVEYTPQRLQEEFGMTPAQFIDYKALRGDPSDNIPGVAGVGEKTAKQLIAEYDSLDGVYAHLAEIKGAVRAKLEADRDMAYLSRQLVEIMCDAPVQLDLAAARTEDCDPAAIQALFAELNFRRLLNDLPEWMKPQAGLFNSAEVAAPGIEPITVKRRETKLSCETALVLTLKELTFISPKPDEAYLLPSSQVEVDQIIGFDTKLDLHRLNSSVAVEFDIMVAAFVLNPLLRRQSLAALAQEVLTVELAEFERHDDMDLAQAGLILAVMWKLYDVYRDQLAAVPALSRVVKEIEWPLIPVLARMEARGMKLDVGYLEKMSDDFSGRIKELETAIYEAAGQEFNINSPQQLQTILFEKLQLDSTGIKKTKTGYSTGASELAKLRHLHPVIDLISRYRELTKLKSTYIDTLPRQVGKDGRLHTTLSQTVAQTGRLSSLHPNLQNIPVRTEESRAIRTAFTAESGNVLISADYSQFELRLAAALSGDKQMITAFNAGWDIHQLTAAELYGVEPEKVSKEQRYNAKAVNFGVMYGMSPHGLSIATGMSREEAASFIKKYFDLRPELHTYLEGLKGLAKSQGYVETLLGRRRPMPDIHSSNFAVRAGAERAAMNMPIQGTEADLMKLAMIRVEEVLDEDCRQVMQVHDSIIVEAPQTKSKQVAQMLKEIMEAIAPELAVRLDVDTSIGETWGELH
ncbi:MAG: DNA polymerase I [Candidatus Saccharimonadales bacterium]